MSIAPTSGHTEIITFSSGKGGTGKTSLISALGYALTYSGHRVLLIDADRATDGLSLFVLGPTGRLGLDRVSLRSTFTALLEAHRTPGTLEPKAHEVDRTKDHGLRYHAIISDRYLYGDNPAANEVVSPSIDRQYDRQSFRQAVQFLFETIRKSGAYDYVLVDSRGGFSFESTDVAAAADSFIVVTEATFTNFYQDRNLIDRIGLAARDMNTQSVLRAIIVNKSTDPPEASFRNELVREFGLRYEDTLVVRLDVEALRVYKEQKAVYREAPASSFAFDSLAAFEHILRIVTSQWPIERSDRWNQLVTSVEAAIQAHNQAIEDARKARDAEQVRLAAAESEREKLAAELERERAARLQEQERQHILLGELREQENRRAARAAAEAEEFRQRMVEDRAAQLKMAEHREAELRERFFMMAESERRQRSVLLAALVAVALAVVVALFMYMRANGFGAVAEGPRPDRSLATPMTQPAVAAPNASSTPPATVEEGASSTTDGASGMTRPLDHPVAPAELRTYKLAIFYLKTDLQSEQIAARLEHGLASAGLTVQRRAVDDMTLTKLVRPNANEVRYEEDELRPAAALLGLLRKIQPSQDWSLRPASTKTPKYLSIFLPPKGPPPPTK